MKKIIQISKLMICIFAFICSISIVLASNSAKRAVPFQYNVICETKNGSAIDTNSQKELYFTLFEPIDEIYFNHQLVEIKENKFAIDISKFTGETDIVLQNQKNETVSFHYYLSDKKGFLENYELVKDKKLNVYITTFDGIKILYTDKEKQAEEKLEKYISLLPLKVRENVTMIQMIPYDNTSNIAGVTKENTITLYKFSKYVKQTQQQIIFHEIAHTWASKLMRQKIIDYSYTDYAQAATSDKKMVSKYAHQFTQENGKYSEDFADSVAFFFMSSSFTRTYPNRASYLQNLLNL